MPARGARAAGWALAAVLGFSAGLSLYLSATLNVWVDEAYSLDTSSQGVAHAWRQALNFELQAPGYFVLLSLWRTLSAAPLWARLFSWLCALGTLLVLVRVCRAYLPRVHPLWLVGPLALHPMLIYAASEIRCPALALLESAGLLLCFFHGYLDPTADPRRARRARLGYVALAVAALYTQYYLGFLLAAGGAALLVTRRFAALGRYMVGMLLPGALILPLVLRLPGQVGAYDNIVSHVGVLGNLRYLYWRLADYLLPAEGEAAQLVRAWALRLLLVALAAALTWSVARARQRLTGGVFVPLLCMVVVLCGFYLAVIFALGHMMLEYRHTIFLFFPLLLTVHFIIRLPLAGRVVVPLALLMLGFNVAALVVKYRPQAKTGDWQRVAHYLMRSERAGQPVLVFKAECVHPLRIYYRGPNNLLPLPREPRKDTWDAAADVLKDETPLRAALRRAPGRPTHFWLVVNKGREWAGIYFHHEVLERFVARHFVTVSSRKFFRSSVLLLKLRTPAAKPARD